MEIEGACEDMIYGTHLLHMRQLRSRIVGGERVATTQSEFSVPDDIDAVAQANLRTACEFVRFVTGKRGLEDELAEWWRTTGLATLTSLWRGQLNVILRRCFPQGVDTMDEGCVGEKLLIGTSPSEAEGKEEDEDVRHRIIFYGGVCRE